MKELKRKIRDLLSEKLSKYGFQRKKEWDIIRIVDNNIVQIISPGLASRNEKHVTYIGIIIGVIYKNIDKIAVRLGEQGRLKYYSPMVGTSIGDLFPEKDYRVWRFALGDSDDLIERNVDEMVDSIVQYGLPYLQKISEIDFFIEKMFEVNRQFYLPIIYYLYGRKEQALEYINNVIKELSSRSAMDEDYRAIMELHGIEPEVTVDNRALEAYMPFVERFRKLVNEKD